MELKRFKRTLRQVLLLPIVACLLLACVLVWQIRGANATVGLIEESDQRIALATLIEKLVVDEETGLRGYQTTSDPRFLQPYNDAEAPMQQAIAELQSTVRPGQQQSSTSSSSSTRLGIRPSPVPSSPPSPPADTPTTSTSTYRAWPA